MPDARRNHQSQNTGDIHAFRLLPSLSILGQYGNVPTNPLSPKCLLPDRHVTLNIASTFDDSFFNLTGGKWVVLHKVHDKGCLISLSGILVTILPLH